MGRMACTEPQCLYKGALYIATKLVLSQLQVPDVDKIGKENKYKKTGNMVRNRNSWGLEKLDLAVD
jgi:hypothetical protein